MPVPIATYRDTHLVWDSEAYARAQGIAIGKLRSRGRPVQVHDRADPIPARVNWNRWIVDCPCGAGAGVDWDAGVARCFLCGAVHRTVVLDADRAAIEAALLQRPTPNTRHWGPGETVAALEAENTAHGCA